MFLDFYIRATISNTGQVKFTVDSRSHYCFLPTSGEVKTSCRQAAVNLSPIHLIFTVNNISIFTALHLSLNYENQYTTPPPPQHINFNQQP